MCVFLGGCGGDVCVNFSFMCLHAFTHKYDASYKKNPSNYTFLMGFHYVIKTERYARLSYHATMTQRLHFDITACCI